MNKLLKLLGVAIISSVIVLSFGGGVGAIAEMYNDGDDRVRRSEPVVDEHGGYEQVIPLSDEDFIVPAVVDEIAEFEPIADVVDEEVNDGDDIDWVFISAIVGGAILLVIIGLLVFKSIKKKN